MSIPLSDYTISRNNNFNLIRFIVAVLVLFSHSFALVLGVADTEPLVVLVGMTAGTIAVDVFFIASGFLITSSYVARNNLLTFFWARLLRIYPALIISVLFCVFVLGPLFTKNNLDDYLSDSQTYRYLVKNAILFFGVEYRLPGVFLDLPYAAIVNGSLWTLPYEVRLYVILALTLCTTTYLATRINCVNIRNSLLLVAALSVVVNIINYFQPLLPTAFIRLLSMFFIGSVFFVWRDAIFLSSKLALCCLVLLLITSLISTDKFLLIYWLTLPYLVFYTAYVPSGIIRKFNECGDYSYGLYIYAFPVQQSAVALFPKISVLSMMLVAFCGALILSILSWHLIESPFLRMKRSARA